MNLHKKSAIFIALSIALPITIALTLSDTLSGSDALGIFYFPAIFLSVVLAGGSRSPGPIAAWSSFAIYTLLYLAIFIVLYAIVLEFYLLRRAFVGLPQGLSGSSGTTRNLDGTRGANAEEVLRGLGRAVLQVEQRRRGHWLLAPHASVDLSQDPLMIGATTFIDASAATPVMRLAQEVRRRLVQAQDSETAAAILNEMHETALRIVRHQGSAPVVQPAF